MLASLIPVAEAARKAHLASGTGQSLYLNAGCDCTQVREAVASFGDTAHIRSHGRKAQAKKAGKEGPPLGRGAHPFLGV